MYFPPEVYVPLQDILTLADIAVMYAEEFNLFLHYKQQNYFKMLMKMIAHMYSSSLFAFYMTEVNLLYIFTYDIRFSNTSDKKHGFDI